MSSFINDSVLNTHINNTSSSNSIGIKISGKGISNSSNNTYTYHGVGLQLINNNNNKRELAFVDTSNLNNSNYGKLVVSITNSNIELKNISSNNTYNPLSINNIINIIGSNNVGIGTTNPNKDFILDVNGAIRTSNITTQSLSINGVSITDLNSLNAGGFISSGAGITYTYSNVGIGISTPQSRLHISEKTSNTEIRFMMTDETTGHTITDGLQLYKTTDEKVVLMNAEYNDLILGTNNNEVFKITSNGNVIINSLSTNQNTSSSTKTFIDLPLAWYKFNNNFLDVSGCNNHLINTNVNSNVPTLTTNITCNQVDFKSYYYTFTENNSIRFSSDTYCELLLVGAGGNGGIGVNGGTGGSGEVIFTDYKFIKDITYDLKIGTSSDFNNRNTKLYLSNNDIDLITAKGGEDGNSVILTTISDYDAFNVPTKSYILYNNEQSFTSINSGTYDIRFNSNLSKTTYDPGNIGITGFTSNYSYPVIRYTDGTIINPTIWYKFDDSTNLGLDSSGNGYDLTNGSDGTPTSVSGIKGSGAVSFVQGIGGTTGQALSKATGGVSINATSFAISTWLYPTALTRGFAFSIGGNAASKLWVGYGITASKYSFSDGDATRTLTTTNTYNDLNTWVHLVFNYTSNATNNKLDIYRNSSLIGTSNASYNFNLINTDSIFLGRRGESSANYTSCYVDDFRFYTNKSLTQTEITELYNGRLTIFTGTPVIYNTGITITTNQTNYNIPSKSYLIYNYQTLNSIDAGNYNISFNSNVSQTIFDAGAINVGSLTTNNSYSVLKDTTGNVINPDMWLKFDDPANIAFDTIGNSTINTVNTLPVYSTSAYVKGSGSAYFDVAGNALSYTYNLNLSTINAFTISFWIKLNRVVATWDNILGIYSGGNSSQRGILSRYGDGGTTLYVEFFGAGTTYSNEFVANNTLWKHYVFIIEKISTNVKISFYKNGTLFTSPLTAGIWFSTTNSSTIQLAAETITSGVGGTSGYINLDDFRIYKRALTADQVQELYNGRVTIYTSVHKNDIFAESGGSINTSDANAIYHPVNLIKRGGSGSLSYSPPLAIDDLISTGYQSSITGSLSTYGKGGVYGDGGAGNGGQGKTGAVILRIPYRINSNLQLPTVVSGKGKNNKPATYFNKNYSQYLYVKNDLELITIEPKTSFCISVWLRPINLESTFEMPIFSSLVSNDDFNYYRDLTNLPPLFEIIYQRTATNIKMHINYNGAILTNTISNNYINDEFNQLNHYVFVFDNTNNRLKMYRNGGSPIEIAFTSSSIDHINKYQIGRRLSKKEISGTSYYNNYKYEYYDGYMYDFRIYNQRVLTSQEISDLYSANITINTTVINNTPITTLPTLANYILPPTLTGTTDFIQTNYNTYGYLLINSNSTITFPQKVSCDVICVGAGGSGGLSNVISLGGGGGAGEVIYYPNFTFSNNSNYSIHIGSNDNRITKIRDTNKATDLITAKGGGDGGFISLSTSRRYPSKHYTGITSETSTTFNGKACKTKNITLDTTGISYGSGTYELYYIRSIAATNNGDYAPIQYMFDHSYTTASASTFYLNTKYTTTGNYTSTEFLVENTYLGSWFVIKLVSSIVLREYKIDSYTRRPFNFRLYGSTDGTTWTMIDDTISATYTGNLFSKTITNNNIFNYYGLVVNKIEPHAVAGDWSDGSAAYIGEFELYGQEVSTTNPTVGGSGGGGSGNVKSISTGASTGTSLHPGYSNMTTGRDGTSIKGGDGGSATAGGGYVEGITSNSYLLGEGGKGASINGSTATPATKTRYGEGGDGGGSSGGIGARGVVIIKYPLLLDTSSQTNIQTNQFELMNLNKLTNNVNITGNLILDGTFGIGSTTNPNFKIDTDGSVIAKDISADGLIVKDVNATNVSTTSLTVGTIQVIDSTRNISGTSLTIGSTSVIDSSRNISGTSLTVGSASVIDSSRNISGNSLTIGSTNVIDSSRNISGNSLTVNELTLAGKQITNFNDIGVGFKSSGSSSIFTNSNIGIGTTNPLALLDVNGTIKSTSNFTDGNMNVNGIITGNSIRLGGTTITNFNDIGVGFKSSGSSNIFTSSNVGIGITNPQSILHIAAIGSNKEIKIILTDESTGNTNNDGLQLYKSSNNEVILMNAESNNLILGTDNKERFRINSNGNIGIGTNNPLVLLDVNGTIKSTSNFISLNSTSSATGILTRNTNAGGTADIKIVLQNNLTSANSCELTLNSSGFTATTDQNKASLINNAGPLQLGTASTPNSLYITNAGNIGINSSTPNANAKLDVNGTIKSTSNYTEGNINTSGNINAIGNINTSGSFSINSTNIINSTRNITNIASITSTGTLTSEFTTNASTTGFITKNTQTGTNTNADTKIVLQNDKAAPNTCELTLNSSGFTGGTIEQNKASLINKAGPLQLGTGTSTAANSLYIESTGNIGINNNTPNVNAKLDVNGTIKSTSNYTEGNINTSGNINAIGNINTSGSFSINSTSIINSSRNITNIASITSSGTLTSEFTTNASTTGFITKNTQTGTNANADTKIVLQNDKAAPNTCELTLNSSGFTGVDQNKASLINKAGPLQLGTGTSTAANSLYIESTGNIGINNNTPNVNAKLDVNGTIKSTSNYTEGNINTSGNINAIGNINTSGSFSINSTSIINSSRNITNIASITSSGTLTSEFTTNASTTGFITKNTQTGTNANADTKIVLQNDKATANTCELTLNSTGFTGVDQNKASLINKAGPLQLGTASATNSLYITNAGNIGINSSTPNAKLDVNGTIKSTSNYTEGDMNVTGYITLGTTRINDFNQISISATGGFTGNVATNKTYTTYNLGIGTDNPQSKLHLSDNNPNKEVRLILTDSTTGYTSNDGLQLYKSSNQEGILMNYENNNLILGTNKTEVIKITSNYEVFINPNSSKNTTFPVLNDYEPFIWYKLNDTNFLDSSGNNYDLTYNDSNYALPTFNSTPSSSTNDNISTTYTFTANNKITFTNDTHCEVLVVGAGGNTGVGTNAGRGGSGEVIFTDYKFIKDKTYNLTVGTNAGTKKSIISLSNNDIIIAKGGGDGASLYSTDIINNTYNLSTSTFNTKVYLRYNNEVSYIELNTAKTYKIIFNANTAETTYNPGEINVRNTTDNSDFNPNNSYPVLKDTTGNVINPDMWLKFDDPANIAFDTIGNSTINTVSILPVYSTSAYVKGSGSAYFDVAGNALSYTYNLNLSTINAFTISFWIKLNRVVATWDNILGIYTTGGTRCIMSRYGDGGIKLYVEFFGTGITYSGEFAANNTLWKHYVFTIEKVSTVPTVSFYKNGTLFTGSSTSTGTGTWSSTTNSSTIQLAAETITSGVGGTNGYINLDDFRIYKRALTATQIQELYNGRVSIYTGTPCYTTIANDKITITNNNSYLYYNDNKNYYKISSGIYDINFNSELGAVITGGSGNGGSVSPVVKNGIITNFNINKGGFYISKPTITLINNTTGSGFSGTVELGGSIISIVLTNVGSGYTSAPTISFSGGGGTGATATATVGSGVITQITLTSGGSGYTSAPTIIISGGGGSSATAIAYLILIVLTAGGSGYTSPLTISFSGGGGTGATATATIAASGGAITGITLTSGGSGYTSAPTITIAGSGGSGSGASATAYLSIGSIKITNGGVNYTSKQKGLFINDTNGGTVYSDTSLYSVIKEPKTLNIIKTRIWYKFDDSTNFTVDSSGNGSNLTNYGAVFDTFNKIKGSGSAGFNYNSYMTIPKTNLNLRTIQTGTGISFSLWFRGINNTNMNNNNKIFDFGNHNGATPTVCENAIQITRDGTTNNLKFQTIASSSSDGNYTTTGTNYFDGSWLFITWTITTGGNWSIYINSLLVSTVSSKNIPNFFNNTNVYYYLGKSLSSTDINLNGNIDDFRIYEKVLSEAEVLELYNGRISIYENLDTYGGGGSNLEATVSNHNYHPSAIIGVKGGIPSYAPPLAIDDIVYDGFKADFKSSITGTSTIYGGAQSTKGGGGDLTTRTGNDGVIIIRVPNKTSANANIQKPTSDTTKNSYNNSENTITFDSTKFQYLHVKNDIELITLKPNTSFNVSVWLRPTASKPSSGSTQMPIFSTMVSRDEFNYNRNKTDTIEDLFNIIYQIESTNNVNIYMSYNGVIASKSISTTYDTSEINNWKHYVFTFNNDLNKLQIYRNGVFITESDDTFINPPTDYINKYQIGRRLAKKLVSGSSYYNNYTNEYFSGNMSDFRIYKDCVLTETQIKELYDGNKDTYSGISIKNNSFYSYMTTNNIPTITKGVSGTDYIQNNYNDKNYGYIIFNSNATLRIKKNNTLCDVICVGAGGSGASSNVDSYGGGGGAGEVIVIPNYIFNTGNYNIEIGDSNNRITKINYGTSAYQIDLIRASGGSDAISLTSSRRYPPKNYTSITSETSTTFNGKECETKNIILDTTGISYGSGTYELYYIRSLLAKNNGDYAPIQYMFDHYYTTAHASTFYLNTKYDPATGYYTSTEFLVENTYKGSWFVIKLVSNIILTEYKIDSFTKRPSNFRLYGSTNGTTWTMIDDTASATYTGNLFSKTITKIKGLFNYYGLVVNKIEPPGAGVGDWTSSVSSGYIGEFELYGQEVLSTTNATIGGSGGGGYGGKSISTGGSIGISLHPGYSNMTAGSEGTSVKGGDGGSATAGGGYVEGITGSYFKLGEGGKGACVGNSTTTPARKTGYGEGGDAGGTTGGEGGRGVVIIKYPLSYPLITFNTQNNAIDIKGDLSGSSFRSLTDIKAENSITGTTITGGSYKLGSTSIIDTNRNLINISSIGIGNDAPTSPFKLDITNDINGMNGIIIKNKSSGTNAKSILILENNNETDNRCELYLNSSGDTNTASLINNSGSLRMGIKGKENAIFIDNLTSNVGINSSSPSYTLDVNGTIKADALTMEGITIRSTNLANVLAIQSSYFVPTSGTNNIKTESNVGIQKTPGYALDVNGTINSTDLRIGGTEVISSTRVVKGDSYNYGSTEVISSTGVVKGASYNVGATEVISSSRVVKGASYNYGSTEVISSAGVVKGASYNVGTTQVIDSSRNLTNIGTITCTRNVMGADFDTFKIISSGDTEIYGKLKLFYGDSSGIYIYNNASTDEWNICMGTLNSADNSLIFSHNGGGIETSKNDSRWYLPGNIDDKGINSLSDERIKKEINDIDNSLQIFMSLKPKEFYICEEKDYNRKYGLIAQDIKNNEDLKHFAFMNSNYIANIFSKATYTNENSIFKITITENTNINFNLILNINDQLKLLFSNDINPSYQIGCSAYENRYKKIIVKVKSIINENTFEIYEELNDLTEEEKQNVFVYGKKVDDFLSLDYDSIRNLNIKATQDLYKIIQTQQTLIETLQLQMTNIQAELTDIKTKINS